MKLPSATGMSASFHYHGSPWTAMQAIRNVSDTAFDEVEGTVTCECWLSLTGYSWSFMEEVRRHVTIQGRDFVEERFKG